MTMRSILALFVLLALCLGPAPSRAQSDEEMQAMMEKAQKYTQPGEHHEALKKFLGDWEIEMRITMPGMEGPASKGTMKAEWLVDGRWITMDTRSPFLGRSARWFYTMGYDNFKQSYVSSAVSNVDTAMNYAEGDMTPDGKALILYGTLDEYLTGEHDKMVKVVFRFLSDDEFLMEIHDLPIGEKNTQVIETRYRRVGTGR